MGNEYSSILLRWLPEFKEIGPGHTVQDFSAAIFMVEQLVAAGASSLVTDHDIFTSAEMLNRIPAILRKRIFVVHPGESWAISRVIMDPILHELGADSHGPGIMFTKGVVEEAAVVWEALPHFVLACRERLQLDFPLDEVRRSLDLLLQRSRDPQARANIVTLAGIFQSYRTTGIDALELNSGMSPKAAEIVNELLEDELYRKMSSASWKIGVPARIERAVLLFSRYARRIAESRLFKPLANLSSKVISTAVHLPMPDSDIGALVTRTGYMPPIVPLRLQAMRARESYLAANPPLLIHPSVREHSEQ